MKHSLTALILLFHIAAVVPAFGQMGIRFPSERRIVPDPVTGVPLTFLTTTPVGDSKIYPTHPQWTADGKWLVFRSNRVRGQAMAVHEETGDIVQVTETGYAGALCVAQKSMRLYFMRRDAGGASLELVAVDLAAVFADSEAGRMRAAKEYEKVVAVLSGELALDATETVAYFRLTRGAAAKVLPAGTKVETNFGPRNMGAGPTGIGSVDLVTGEAKAVVAVGFQVGHIQSNPFVPGEIVFCWETGGKAPQRTWTVRADGTGLRPLFPEASFDWVTHEAVITKDEVAVALMGHRAPGTSDEWGASGTREHPTGLGIVNLRTREVYVAGQTKKGSGLWHVHGSSDGRWGVGDDFDRNLWLIDRHSNEMMLLSTGHNETAADHVHPTFNADGTKIEIQSAMLAKDGRSMNICIVPVPEAWLKRAY
jgi:oligogalacturonide lyase